LIQSQKRTEGCLTKPDGKAVVSRFGSRVGAHGTPVQALRPAKENKYALESLDGCIVCGCRELKRKFRLKLLDGHIVRDRQAVKRKFKPSSLWCKSRCVSKKC
jgi:hypothetical protein